MKNFSLGSFTIYILVVGPLLLFYSCEAKTDETEKENKLDQHNELPSDHTPNNMVVDSSESLQLKQLKMPILKEGMVDTIQVELYHSPAASPIPFELYFPSELEFKVYKQNGFTLELRRNEALLKLHIFKDEVDIRKEALLMASKQLSGLGELVETENGWILNPNSKLIASVEVNEIDGKFIYWLKKYPAEYADGFGAEVYFIKENIRWH